MPKIEVISFFWENKKRRPNCYSFRYSKLIKTGKPGECYINHSCQEVSWDNFFDTWDLETQVFIMELRKYLCSK